MYVGAVCRVQVSPNGHEVLRQFDEELETTLLDMQEGRQELSDEECGKGMPLVMFQKRMTNEDLAHELLLDPMFQLDKQYGSSTDVTPSMRVCVFFWLILFVRQAPAWRYSIVSS